MHLHAEIMKNMTEGVYLIRLSDGKIVYANPKFENMFGYDPGELIGKEVSIVNAPTEKTPEETKNEIVDILKKTGEWHGEVKNIKKDGTHFYCFANVSIFDHPEYGRVIISVHTDITERKKIEKLIKQSEERLKLAQRISQVGSWDWNIKEGTLSWSDEIYRQYDLKTNEIVPSYEAWTKFIHPDDLDYANHSVKQALEEDIPYSIDIRMISKKGRQFVIHDDGTVYKDENGKMVRFIGTQHDITQSKKAEEKLIESELRLREIIDNAPFGAHMYELHPDGRLVFTGSNPAADHILGVENKQFINKTIEEAFPHLIRTEIPAAYRDVAKNRTHFETESIEYKENKIIGAFEVSAFQTGQDRMAAFFRDISERKKAEELIKRSKEFAETVLNSMNDAITIIDVNNFKIIDANSVFLNNYDVKKEDVLGKTCYEVTHKRDRPCTLSDEICPLIETLKTGKHSKTEHFHYIQNGEKRYIEVSTTPIIDENGKIVNVIHLARDITDRRLAEEKIEASLKEKEILLKEIHHRVKNNMQIISSLLGLTAGTITDNKYVDMFMDSQNRINSMSLIHEKLYLSKDLAQIDLNDYIRDLANNLFQSHMVTGRIELLLNIKNVSLGIDLAIPCGLIINELITNSLKYAFPGDRKGQIKVSAYRNEENIIELIFSDNGVGIPSNIDFRNTKSLGLHLVTMLAEGQLHARIDLDRTRGTEFKIIFKGVK